MTSGFTNLNDWLLGKLEPLKDSKRVLVRDPLQVFNKVEGVIHNFAKENGFTVIVAATNLVFRDLYEQAVDDAEVRKILALDRTPAKRRKVQSPNQAPPLFYPDLLADTPASARIEVDLRQFLQEATNDPLWPPATNDRQYARLILDHLGGVIRAHQNLVATSRGQFTDHDFQTVVAYAALGIPESAFKSHDTLDYWKIGLQGHAVIKELADLSPEATRLIKGELRKAPEPFCWFVDREPEQVIRAFYLSVILSQQFQQWSPLLANIDPSLQPMSGIKATVLKDAAPQLIALDRQQAQNDLEAVESSLTKENLQFLLVEQLKLTGVGVAVSAIEKEKYSPLFRSLALLVALDDLLSGKPDAAAHQKIGKILFPEPGAVQKESGGHDPYPSLVGSQGSLPAGHRDSVVTAGAGENAQEPVHGYPAAATVVQVLPGRLERPTPEPAGILPGSPVPVDRARPAFAASRAGTPLRIRQRRAWPPHAHPNRRGRPASPARPA